jgi:penicillin-binding protein 2
MDAAGIERIRRGMWSVVQTPSGTAARVKIEGVEMAGKTGTAEFVRNGKMEKHAWFIGFVPYEQPRYAVCVFVFLGKGGGAVAAPIAREIFVRALELEGNPQMEPTPMDEIPGEFRFLELPPVFDGGSLLVETGEPGTGDGEAESAPVLDPDDARLSTRTEDVYEIPELIRIQPPAVGSVEAGPG